MDTLRFVLRLLDLFGPVLETNSLGDRPRREDMLNDIKMVAAGRYGPGQGQLVALCS